VDVSYGANFPSTIFIFDLLWAFFLFKKVFIGNVLPLDVLPHAAPRFTDVV
jgi:hypothetical protein